MFVIYRFIYVHMRSLKEEYKDEEYKEAYEYLQNGGCNGSLSGRPHSRTPFNQVIEMIINTSSKQTGGLSCKTQNLGAVERLTRTNHLMVALREHIDNTLGKETELNI